MNTKEIADNGLNLLKKGKQGLVHALIGRVGLLILSILIQAAVLFGLFSWFEDTIPIYLGGSVVFTISILLYLVNSTMDPSAKITWLIIIMVLPVFGCLFYLWTHSAGKPQQQAEQGPDLSGPGGFSGAGNGGSRRRRTCPVYRRYRPVSGLQSNGRYLFPSGRGQVGTHASGAGKGTNLYLSGILYCG